MWVVAVISSALFAGITTILSKCGLKNTNSNLATALRTSVVLLLAWLIVWITGAFKTITDIRFKSWIFLILSGLATGTSWICYFKALSLGEVSKVAAVDKSSAILSVLLALILFSYFVFHEKLSMKSFIGLLLLIVWTVCMAFYLK